MTPKVKTLCERSFSSVVLLGLLGGAVWWNEPIGYAVLVGLFCNLTSWEWFNMLREKKDEVCRPVVLVLSLLYPWAMTAVALGTENTLPSRLGFALAYAVLYIILLFFCGLFRMDYCGKNGAQALSGMGLGLLAFFYPVWLFCFSIPVLGIPAPEVIYGLLLIILATKMSDIWAYVSGILLGGKFFTRKFSPTISPKKTWEGIIGSFILTTAATYFLAQALVPGTAVAKMPPYIFIPAMAVFFIVAVAGDLAGSLIKRGLGVKDSGSLLPGIGGSFDLLDSPAFTIGALTASATLIYISPL